jgi:protein TonB
MQKDPTPIAEMRPRDLWLAFAGALALHGVVVTVGLVMLAGHEPPPAAPGSSALLINLAAVSDAPEAKDEPEAEPEPEPEEPEPEIPPPPPEPVERAAVAEPEPPREQPKERKQPREQTQNVTTGTGGLAKTGAAEVGIATETMDADFLARVGDWLARHKKYPRAAQRRRIEGEARLRFTVAPDGRVLSYSLDSGTGSVLLDSEVTAMLERASPLPAFAPGMGNESREFVVPVRLELT